MRANDGLGFFYLGKEYDLEKRERSPDVWFYDAKQLTTHAVCVGMTGSGKTGLCLSLLEEAAINGVPILAIDPKGDIGNLMLGFPELRGSDFLPWIDADEAARQGLSREAFADKAAADWREGLADWHQDGARIQRLHDTVDMAIYTPGSNAGLPLTVLRSFAAPSQSIRDDAEAYRDHMAAAASGLLSLLGINADPIASREHILLSTILDQSWMAGRDLGLTDLIHEVQSPSFDKIGAIDLETFFPAKDRFALAIRINNLVASPGFAGWMEGEPLDIGKMLYTEAGKPRVSIVSIAHMSESERMFFVTILLNEVLAWTRSQSGSSSLRAIVYMDEIFGYFPPTANPPTKKPMLTLLKQARAFGVGVVLATQNPVDLDYKGLSNAGTWLIGRLQTQRDKNRVLEGLEGASVAAGKSFDRARMDQALSALGKRVFLMSNVHEDAPIIFESRQALSYLRGPITREQIQALMAPRKRAQAAPTAAKRIPINGESRGRRPVVPPDVPEFFLIRGGSTTTGPKPTYRPALLGVARLHYADKKTGVDHWETIGVMSPASNGQQDDAWRGERLFVNALPKLSNAPETGASFAPLPSPMAQAKNYPAWSKALKDRLYQARKLTVWTCPALKATSRPGETEEAFRARLERELKEAINKEVAPIRAAFAPRLEALRIRKQNARSNAETAAVNQAIAAVNSELHSEIGRVYRNLNHDGRVPIVPVEIPPRKADIAIEKIGLAWIP